MRCGGCLSPRSFAVGHASTTGDSATIDACVNGHGLLRVLDPGEPCTAGESPSSWTVKALLDLPGLPGECGAGIKHRVRYQTPGRVHSGEDPAPRPISATRPPLERTCPGIKYRGWGPCQT
jgi:hypothetical protein